MSDPLKGNRRNLPDHGTPTGDQVAAMLVIKVSASGALSIEGNIEDKTWALLALDHAKVALEDYHVRKAARRIIPATDVDPGLRKVLL